MLERKQIRLKDYEYLNNGVYFITICTKDKKCLLGSVGATIGRQVQMVLSKYGHIVDNVILDIPNHYKNVFVDKYVIMPNHIHIILFIRNDEGRAMHAPTISRIIQQLKGIVTKQVGYSIWQKLFYDHIIRNEHDYQQIWKYIDDNPIKWTLDKYYK